MMSVLMPLGGIPGIDGDFVILRPMRLVLRYHCMVVGQQIGSVRDQCCEHSEKVSLNGRGIL
jgi:hypothetical protein